MLSISLRDVGNDLLLGELVSHLSNEFVLVAEGEIHRDGFYRPKGHPNRTCNLGAPPVVNNGVPTDRMYETPAPEAPPQIPPVIEAPPPQEDKRPRWVKKLGPIGTALAFLAAKAKALFTFLFPILKLLKFGKILLTAGTMLVSVWLYAHFFGWQFAVGFVLLIFVHEMGHVIAAAFNGVPVSAPIFIPGFGALIIGKRFGKSGFVNAIIGIGGPIGGTFAALACWAIYGANGNSLFLALAFVGFMMNLFNMMPMYPMDGGRIVGSISPYLWGFGLVGLLALMVTGYMNNFMLIILIILSVPQIWTMLKRGTMDPGGGIPTTAVQKWGMGAAYVGLCAFLMWGMNMTRLEAHPSLHRAGGTQVATLR